LLLPEVLKKEVANYEERTRNPMGRGLEQAALHMCIFRFISRLAFWK